MVRVESAETLRDGQEKREHSGLCLIWMQQFADEVEENRNAVAWSEKSGDVLGIRQCGYFPTKDIQKALKVCFRGLLVEDCGGFH